MPILLTNRIGDDHKDNNYCDVKPVDYETGKGF